MKPETYHEKLKNKIDNRGFSVLEVLVSVAIFSIILLAVVSFIFWMRHSNSQTKSDRESLENTRRIMDIISYEVKNAKSIYTPTTSSSQLSLETSKYLPNDEDNTFIDFFLCGSRICFKKESQDPYFLTSDTVQVTNLQFTQLLNGARPSIKIDLTVNYNDPSYYSAVDLTSTVAPRSY